MDDIDRVAADLGRAGFRATAAAAAQIGRSADKIKDMGRELCISRGIGASITVDHDGLSAEIGPEDWRGHFVEYGTVYQAPSAYMGPSLDREGPELVQALADVIDPFG